MNKHLEDYLVKKYPEIFRDMYGDMRTTCMHWGCECGDGWFHLLDSLCESIQNRVNNPPYVRSNKFTSRLKVYWNNFAIKVGLGYKYTFNYDMVWNPIPQVVATQIKEKFGGLRFYTEGGDDVTRTMINFAEQLSYNICENCGRFDETVGVTQGWIQHICPQCSVKFKNPIKQDETKLKLWEMTRKDSFKKEDIE